LELASWDSYLSAKPAVNGEDGTAAVDAPSDAADFPNPVLEGAGDALCSELLLLE
jgi:hypothetical protein